MKRRLIAIVLALVMLFSLCASVSAADALQRYDVRKPATKGAMDDGYVYCCAESNDPTFVKGSTAELSFKRRVATPSSSDNFIIEIYKGTANQLLAREDLPLVEKRSYSISKFTSPSYILTASFKLDSKYSTGNYAVLWGIRNSSGKQYSSDYDYIMDMQVVSSEIPATDVTAYVIKGTNGGIIAEGETLLLYPSLLPDNATTPRKFSVKSSQPAVATVTTDAGFIYVRGVAVGTTEITISCGNLKKTIQLGVGQLQDFSLTQGTTRLCVGNTDTIRTSAQASSGNVVYTWKSSDPSIATVKNGVVKGVAPGTVTITASCYNISKTVTYTVNYHQLPANTPVTTRTATQPRQATGPCSVCGKDNCVNIYEPAIFTDTKPNAWYSRHVDFCYDNGLMNGLSEHTFGPNNSVTRGMVVTVLYRMVGQPAVSGSSGFSDVPKGKYYSNAVIWAQGLGVVKGFEDGTYRPNDNVTREQLAAILYRFSISKGESINSMANLIGFPDYNKVHSYAKTAIAWAVAEGIIGGVNSNGKDYLQPTNSATRAQFATIISRYLQRGGAAG